MVRPLLLLPAAAAASAAPVTSISQHGVTIEFGAAVASGQYVTGDYWVVGPVVVVSTSPPAAGGRHGFEVSPRRGDAQPYDDRAHGYDASLLPALPLTVAAGNSIVKARSNGGWNGSNPTYLQTAVVLTVLAAPPAHADAFRPPYFRPAGWAPAAWRLSDVDWARYPSVAPPAGLPNVTLGWIEGRYAMPQLDHMHGWSGATIHPEDNMPRCNYGQAINTDTGVAATRLLLDDAAADKSRAAAGLLQYGIDIAAIVAGGGGFPANGGWANGRKMPFALVAYLLGDAALQAAVRATSASPATFSEDGEITTPGAVTLWGAHDPWGTEDSYWKLVVTGNGEKIAADPYHMIDGGSVPGHGYDYCCVFKPWKGSALPLLLSDGLAAVFNSTRFADFVVRRATFGAWTQPDTCAPPTGNCSDGSGRCAGWHKKPCGAAGTCALDMADYGTKWGPSGTAGSCIRDSDASDGVGRFPDLHGADKDEGYGASPFVEAMWGALAPRR